MKTRFTKEMLKKSGQYLLMNDEKRTFIARFKYSGPITMGKFKKELISNHYVEDYLEGLASRKAPLEILKEKNPGWYKGIMDDFMNKNS